jgi:hypothetical protein
MTTPTHPHAAAIDALRQSLEAQAAGRLDLPALVREWRAAGALVAALPPRYGEVLDQLLSRLEAAGGFGDESCSFSAEDLRENLGTWLERAAATLVR